MRSKSVLAALLTIASAYPPGVPAWGGLGHRTMGAIADRLLGPTARAGVAELLGGDVDKPGAPSGRRTLETESAMAGAVCHTPGARARRPYDDAPGCRIPPDTRHLP